ncbi:hypothetical protein [Luteolibacter soli]|uniref:HEAT repeat domain-containing protein n=1 Tax=Luteolibacter soli TaxID=3135280 RepID=A0ABU9B178_9BACT
MQHSRYGQAFIAALEAISPGLSKDISRASLLEKEQARQLFSFLLERACQCQHMGNITLGRLMLKEVPENVRVAHLEETAHRVLDLEDEWEFRQLLWVYDELGRGEAFDRLILRGLASTDPDLREAAQDWMERPLQRNEIPLSQ